MTARLFVCWLRLFFEVAPVEPEGVISHRTTLER